MEAHGLVPDLPDEEYWAPGGLVHGHVELVLGPGVFDGLAHRAFRPKKAVRRHGIADALMGAEMVVQIGETMPTRPDCAELRIRGIRFTTKAS